MFSSLFVFCISCFLPPSVQDGPRILKNIRGFAAAGIERLIMLAPEGTIADPGVAADEAYVAECRKFMAALGKPPMEYLLTPRYKVRRHTQPPWAYFFYIFKGC